MSNVVSLREWKKQAKEKAAAKDRVARIRGSLSKMDEIINKLVEARQENELKAKKPLPKRKKQSVKGKKALDKYKEFDSIAKDTLDKGASDKLKETIEQFEAAARKDAGLE